MEGKESHDQEQSTSPEPNEFKDTSELDQLLRQSDSLKHQSNESPINLKIQSVDTSVFPEQDNCKETSFSEHSLFQTLSFSSGIESPASFFQNSFLPEEIEK